jgi:hypothetical protein
MDFVSLGDKSIMSFTNDKSANFDTTDVASFTEYYSFCVGDLNGDGYPDLIAGSARIYTFINDGNGILVRNTTNESIITPQIHETELADMDGDNDLDLVVYYMNTLDKVDWYSNDGSGILTKEGTITSNANNIHSITLGDIDQNNKIDLSLGYDQVDDLVWIKNLGNGSFSNEIAINSSILLPRNIVLGDLDNDGDLDLCHSAHVGLFYYLNNTAILSINETQEMSVSWYPNPSNGSIFVESSVLSTVRIYDMYGNMKYIVELPEGNNHIEPALPNGKYILEIQNSNGVNRSKLILLN